MDLSGDISIFEELIWGQKYLEDECSDTLIFGEPKGFILVFFFK